MADEKPPEGEQKPKDDDQQQKPADRKSDDPDAQLLQGARNPDAVKNALDQERQTAREARKRAEAAEARAKEYEDRDKTEQQKLEEKAAGADRRASQAELKALRYEVAAEKDLPLKWASRLSGSTKEELASDADELAKEIKPERPDFDGGTRQAEPKEGDMDSFIRRKAGRAG